MLTLHLMPTHHLMLSHHLLLIMQLMNPIVTPGPASDTRLWIPQSWFIRPKKIIYGTHALGPSMCVPREETLWLQRGMLWELRENHSDPLGKKPLKRKAFMKQLCKELTEPQMRARLETPNMRRQTTSLICDYVRRLAFQLP
ncbi:hypothetical protein J6590_102820 [Homalodisca vitripennis]|nr:hypothetical protein J6590_102820 [Homalodisca vitripennis]